MNFPEYDKDFWKVWSQKEIEFQMTPINWIVGKDKRQSYNDHLKISTDETAKAKETIPCKLDVSYGDHELKKFDIYGTDLPKDAQSFVFVHGGYWQTGNKSWSAPFARNAYNWGVRSIVLNYPLAPKARLPDMCNAICEALIIAMRLFPESNFVLGGHSAGVQLLLSLFHRIPGVVELPDELKSKVIGCFFLSGPYDMRAFVYLRFNKALQLKEEESHHYSGIMTMDKIHDGWIQRKNKIRFLLGFGENDPPSLRKLASIYADMLQKSQFTTEYWISEGDDHFTIVDNLVNPESGITKKLKNFLHTLNNPMKRSKL